MPDVTQDSVGSIWRRWDLHIHSPLSILNNQFPSTPEGRPDWEAYISRLEQLDFAVIGITDYFTIDGYKVVRGFKEAGRLPKTRTILPNIEFRLKSIVSSRGQKRDIRLNLHVIFSDKVPPDDIEEHFLHDIDFYFQGNPQNADEKRKLKVSNLKALGEQLLREHARFREMGLTPLQVGAMQAVVDDEQIKSILSGDSRFRSKYLVVLAADGWDEIDWDGQAHLVRKGLLRKSHMVFSANPRTRAWCLGTRPYEEGAAQFREEFSTLKPCIHGSDAHKLSEAGNPCSRRGDANHNCADDPQGCAPQFCWIKADPTFEGLKQLLYEPDDRVAIQPDDPTPLKSGSCISGFRSDGRDVNEELSLSPVNLPLNSGLVAVTGGKGAGKTALVDLLANFFTDRCNTSDQNSFVRRIVSDGADLQMAITFGDGALFEKALKARKFVQETEIVYIAQGELEDYIGENSDLDKYVRDLIFESPEVKNTFKAFEFEKLAKKVSELENDLVHKTRIIEGLEARTAESVLNAAKREKAQAEAESRDVESKIPTLESRLTKEKIDVVTEKQLARSELQGKKIRLGELSDLLANAQQFVAEDLLRFNSYASQANKLLKELNIEGELSTLEYPAAGALEDVATNVEKELAAVVARIEASETELKGYEAQMQEHARYLSRKSELATKLDATNKKLAAIARYSEELEKAREERDALFRELLITIIQQKQKYSEIIEIFAVQKAAVLSDLSFQANVQVASKALLAGLKDILDNRQVQVMPEETAPSHFETLLALYEQVARNAPNSVENLVAETSRLCEDLKGNVKTSRAITVLNLYRCLYSTYLTVTPTVTYKRTALNRLSLGQKATVLIKIYLARGSNPIIIDSHDDHLDNEFIMEELVGAIRQAKTYRQVILASNNGNVVINSDAEQIIIADRQQGKISYDSGSIENPTIRDRALKVLEGGADAFKRRQEKYRIED